MTHSKADICEKVTFIDKVILRAMEKARQETAEEIFENIINDKEIQSGTCYAKVLKCLGRIKEKMRDKR